MSSPEVIDGVERLDGGQLADLLGRAVQRYAELSAEAPELLPLPADGGPSPTDVAVTVSAMLEQSGIEVFELGLWRSFGAPRQPTHEHGGGG